MARRRVFLDVGGHVGETLSVVVDRRWGFDRIWSFEPSQSCHADLERFADARVEIVPAGLWSSDCDMDLNDPGTLHASVERRWWHETAARCQFIDAARWMDDNIRIDDEVWMKVNIEAAEVEVLERLMDTGQLAKVDHLVVHFDVEKIGMQEKGEHLRTKLAASGVEWCDAASVLYGRTTQAKTQTWLLWSTGHHWQFRSRRFAHLARRQVWKVRRSFRSPRGR